MATGWVKSLQCKSNAVDDVYHPKSSPLKKPLLPLSSCGSSSHALRDVVLLFPKHPPIPSKPSSSSSSRRSNTSPPPSPPPPKTKPRPKPPKNRSKSKPRNPLPPPSPAAPPPAHSLPTLAELPAGHSSRRVVEIIFSSSWSRRGPPFPGEIEMLFRVHNPPRTTARFEEYRSAVRARSGGGDARCAADGNEMMRFHCSTSSSSSRAGAAIYDAGVASCAVASPGGKVVEAIRTFAGSGGAHESGGGGAGRRAMLVCRVIAGRVQPESGPEAEGESVSVGAEELLVFDPRSVLPCFLIIYKV